MTENTPAPLATTRTRSHVTGYDAALRDLSTALEVALASGVDLDAIAVRVLMAARGHSLPGRQDYTDARTIAAIADHRRPTQEPTA